MDARLVEKLEANVERGASAAFAGAVGFAVFGAFGELPLQPELGLGIGVATIIAYHLCATALGVIAAGERHFTMREFDVRDIEPVDDALLLTSADRIGGSELVLTDGDKVETDELLLTDADRLGTAEGTLVLDDILHELRPDARVVRLFDRKAMPTPGQLKSRIDNHLDQAPARPLSDASQALSDALAELRRSLR